MWTKSNGKTWAKIQKIKYYYSHGCAGKATIGKVKGWGILVRVCLPVGNEREERDEGHSCSRHKFTCKGEEERPLSSRQIIIIFIEKGGACLLSGRYFEERLFLYLKNCYHVWAIILQSNKRLCALQRETDPISLPGIPASLWNPPQLLRALQWSILQPRASGHTPLQQPSSILSQHHHRMHNPIRLLNKLLQNKASRSSHILHSRTPASNINDAANIRSVWKLRFNAEH